MPGKKSKFLILCLLTLFSLNIFAQEQIKYTISFENQPLKQLLNEISEQGPYKFAFSETEIDLDQITTLKVKNASLEEILNLLARKYQIEAELLGRTIILKPVQRLSYFIRGRVIDSNSSLPLQWVNISTIDNRHGTLSDSSGLFALKVAAAQTRLRFSFIGYKPQEIDIFKDTILNIALIEDVRELDEIVVVAFGNEQRDLIGGAVSIINPGIFRQLNDESINGSLQSSLTGVLVQNNAGTPGSSINVTIRGISSITAGNSPLYIIDGIPMINGNYSQLDFSGQTLDAITDLSINDIESVSILKDASAASLYGASSSNGVILINTKQGSESGSQIQIDSYYGMQETTGKLSLLNANQWMNLINEDAIESGEEIVYSSDEIKNNTIDTDWLKEVFRLAPTYNFYLSASGGNEKSKYYVSGNYFDQEGIVIGSSYNRYSFRVNYDYKISEKFLIEVGNGFSYSNNSRIEGDQSLNGPLPVGISMPPIYPVMNPDGSYNNDGPYANPVSIANDEKNIANTYRNLFNLAATYKIRPNLHIQSRTGVDFYTLGEQTFAPKTTRQGAKYNGLGIEANNNTFLIYNSSYFNYTFDYKQHHFSLLGGFSLDRYRNHGTYLRAQNFPGSSFEFLQNAATPIIASSNELDATSNSLFSSLKYNIADKYILSFNLRRDGSSKFGANNRYGYFPSVSGLWYVSREGFWKDNALISKLKLKASYGQTGNDQIQDFISLDLFAAGSNYNGQAGISPHQLSNPDLRWETTNQLNLGMDIGIAKKINLNADFYRKITKDLLLENPIPTSTGYSYFISNIGEIQNRGVEVELAANLDENEIKWKGSLSFSANQNRVLKLYQDQPIRNIGRASSSIEVGEPVSFFYGFVSKGVNPTDGLLIYEDINEDGLINDLDRTKIGSPFPLFHGGFLNTFTYKSFSLSFLVFYSYGNDIFNSTRLYTETISIGNQSTAILDRWKAEGDQTDVPKASSYNERVSSRFVEDGSYIRLKNLKLTYRIKDNIAGRMHLNSLEFYIAGKNLLTLTDYSGMDPEVNYNSSNSIILGTDFFTNPQAKSILFGVCAKF